MSAPISAKSKKPTPAIHEAPPAKLFAMPFRPPTAGQGIPSYVVIRPFWVRCSCTVCDAYTLVDGAGKFMCPNGCGCFVEVK
jgi:hypothetical protein